MPCGLVGEIDLLLPLKKAARASYALWCAAGLSRFLLRRQFFFFFSFLSQLDLTLMRYRRTFLGMHTSSVSPRTFLGHLSSSGRDECILETPLSGLFSFLFFPLYPWI